MTSHLTAADIALELGVSRARAYRILRDFGAGTITRRTFNEWLIARTIVPSGQEEWFAEAVAIYRGTVDDLVPMDAPTTPGVYFIRGAGLVKIGRTTNVRDRFGTLRTASPVPLDLLAVHEVGDDGFVDERRYHHAFRAHRVRGEWFSLHPDIAETILEIRSGL